MPAAFGCPTYAQNPFLGKPPSHRAGMSRGACSRKHLPADTPEALMLLSTAEES